MDKNNNGNKMTFNKDSKIELTKVIDSWIDEAGNKFKKVIKEIATKPIELGSIKNPLNTDIIQITISVPSGKQNKDDTHSPEFLRDLFKD